MSESLRRVYIGDGKTHYEKALPGAFLEPEPYIATKSLADAVNISLYLRRPLLLEGDPVPRQEYVTLGKLGEAIELSQQNIPSVVLIDEIDKADIDFPNDLLQVLDRMEFEIDEVRGWKFEALSGLTRQERRDFLPLF